jgi:hypothetical protein
MGIDLKRFMECVAKTCTDKPKERIPGLIRTAFLEARRRQLAATPHVSFRKAAPAKALRRPAPPAPKPRQEVETPTMFMPLADMPTGMATHTRRKAAKK